MKKKQFTWWKVYSVGLMVVIGIALAGLLSGVSVKQPKATVTYAGDFYANATCVKATVTKVEHVALAKWNKAYVEPATILTVIIDEKTFVYAQWGLNAGESGTYILGNLANGASGSSLLSEMYIAGPFDGCPTPVVR